MNMLNNEATLSSVVERIHLLVEHQQMDEVERILMGLHPADRAEVFDSLPDQAQTLLLEKLDTATTADLLLDFC
ncbi:MAG: hypothetical protein AB1345_13850 [Chloroflexota bacterium]